MNIEKDIKATLDTIVMRNLARYEILPNNWAYELNQPDNRPGSYLLAYHETGEQAWVRQPYKFDTGKQMLEVLQKDVDLYEITDGTYVFHYNEAGAVASYGIDKSEAKELEAEARECNEYWAAFLGPGGYIYDDPDDPDLEEIHGMSNIEFCEYVKDGIWIPTDNVITGHRLEM